jgi:peroxiredoxin
MLERMNVAIGAPAPAIELPTHDGALWRLGDHAGRPVVLVFHRHLA